MCIVASIVQVLRLDAKRIEDSPKGGFFTIATEHFEQVCCVNTIGNVARDVEAQVGEVFEVGGSIVRDEDGALAAGGGSVEDSVESGNDVCEREDFGSAEVEPAGKTVDVVLVYEFGVLAYSKMAGIDRLDPGRALGARDDVLNAGGGEGGDAEFGYETLIEFVGFDVDADEGCVGG